MTMLSRLREKRTGNLATAIPAISATQPKGVAGTVARIATVAVANPKEEKTAPTAKVGAGDTATASRWWLIHYPDRDTVEVACCPEATHADILERHPDAVAAEPFTPTIRQPSAPLTASEETAIRAWLALIEETDPAIIAEVLTHCQQDTAARAYFLGRAMPVNQPSTFWPEIAVDRNPSTLPTIEESETDDRRTCQQCLNLRGRVCSIAKPERGALVVANVGYRPHPDTPHRCAGYLPNATDKDQRPGGERWPGLTNTKGTK